MKDKISVLIAVYNVEEYLPHCIESVINQTYKNIEIIIIDDGSTDKSGIISDEYAKKDKRIIVYHIDNHGLSYVRNMGIKLSKGKYISFIDGDDYIESDFIEILYNNLIKYNADLSCCSYYGVFKRNIKPRNNKINLYIMNSDESVEKSFLDKGLEVYAWNKLYKRELFDIITFPLGKRSQDRFVMYDIFLKCNKVVYESIPKYYYLQRKSSAAHNLENINRDAIEASYKSICTLKDNSNLYNLASKDYIKTKLGTFKKEMYYTRSINKELRKEIIGDIKDYNYINYSNSEKIELYIFKHFKYLYQFISYIYYFFKYSKMI